MTNPKKVVNTLNISKITEESSIHELDRMPSVINPMKALKEGRESVSSSSSGGSIHVADDKLYYNFGDE